MKNKQLIISLAIFLLLVPFRLPIGVLLISIFIYISSLAGGNISTEIMQANVVVTKLIYDIALSSIFVYNIQMMSEGIKGRKANDGLSCPSDVTLFWWSGWIAILLIIYIGFDAYQTSELYLSLTK